MKSTPQIRDIFLPVLEIEGPKTLRHCRPRVKWIHSSSFTDTYPIVYSHGWKKEKVCVLVLFLVSVSVSLMRGLYHMKSFLLKSLTPVVNNLRDRISTYRHWEYANIQSIVGPFMADAPWNYFFVSSKFIFCLDIVWKASKRHNVKWLQVVFYLQGDHRLSLY